MTNAEIIKKFNIPKSTYYDWIKKDDYRKKIIEYLKKEK
jgi:transposase